jgi:hypothetical protein
MKSPRFYPPVAASNKQHSQESRSPQYGQAHIHASNVKPQCSHSGSSSFPLAGPPSTDMDTESV